MKKNTLSVDGNRMFTLSALADIYGCDELTVIDAVRLYSPRMYKKGICYRFREIEAVEIRKYVRFEQKINNQKKVKA